MKSGEMSHGSGDAAVSADDVAWQQAADDDISASLKKGCLKLGVEKIGADNNNFELRQRQRFALISSLIFLMNF